MKELKIRASSLGRLMSSDSATTITEKQLDTLNDLLTKIKLTDKQATLRDSLMLKRDAPPELSKGAKSYIKELFMFHEYGVGMDIYSKYMEKGVLTEDECIDLCSSLFDYGELKKNEVELSNEYITGTPDIVNDMVLIDVKSKWSPHQCFWLAETDKEIQKNLDHKVYEWQLKSYMWLTGHVESELVYCLVATPEHLVLDEMRRLSWKKLEGGEVSIETEAEVRAYFDISNIPTEKRVKSFKVELTEKDVADMKIKVNLARKYYKQIQ